MLNYAVVTGRLGQDIELKQTPNGISVASFSLAVSRDFKDKETGERGTDWINIVAWRGTAEFAAKYFSKGSVMTACGRIQTRSYTDKDGGKRYSTEIVAEHIYFGESSGEKKNYVPSGNYEANPSGFTEVEIEDDFPF